MSDLSQVIKLKPATTIIRNAEKNSVYFCPVGSALFVCIYSDRGEPVSVSTFNSIDEGDLKSRLAKALTDLNQKKSSLPLNQIWHLKAAGTKPACLALAKVAATLKLKIESIGNIERTDFEAYFFADSARLRIREVEDQPAIKNITPAKKRVLIVDDSKTMRSLLTKIIGEDPELEVVGQAERPSLVEDLLRQLKPDVMTLDINMPEMDGVTLIEKLLPKYPIPTVMISAVGIEEGTQVLRALELGAVDYVQKPELDQLDASAVIIREKVRTAASVAMQRVTREVKKPQIAPVLFAPTSARGNYIAMGASTGGTEALRAVLMDLPQQIPPILIVQHIPPVFSTAFAKRLNDCCPFEVKEAEDGDKMRDGLVLIAPGGKQMELVGKSGEFHMRVYEGAPVNRHKPSVDVLFNSVAALLGKKALGVLLTGMGTDGAQGLLKMHQAGSWTIAQDEATSVVYGMPGAAAKLGAASAILPLEEIGKNIILAINKIDKIARKAI